LDKVIQNSTPDRGSTIMTNYSSSAARRAALVLGGSRGIGAAIVRRLARDGAAVAFTYAASADKGKEIVRELESRGGKALAIRADSTEIAAVQAAVEETVGTFGRLDILVNNAGIMVLGTIDQYKIEDFDRMLAVNVRAPYFAIQAAARHMGPGGRAITIGSIVAERSAFPGSSVYSLTKGAVAAMVRGLAIDLAPRGITVNNVQPGPTLTDMNPADGPHAEQIVKMLPVGRFGRDEEIAGMVAYLASTEAAFVTGSSLTIDGGYLA
jgi:3-oxoacyl-[acyl-carrier protein] reductase